MFNIIREKIHGLDKNPYYWKNLLTKEEKEELKRIMKNRVKNNIKIESESVLCDNRPSGMFNNIIGCEDEKGIFKLAIESDQPVHILITGPPASAKTLFLFECEKLPNTYFVDNNSTGPGIIEYLFEHPNTEYLLIDEFEKLSVRDQNALLNVMEFGLLQETKVKNTLSQKMNLKIFATSNDIDGISGPIKSRFFRINLKEYTEDEFTKIGIGLLKENGHDEIVSKKIVDSVWNIMKSGDIRDVVKIGKMTKKIDEVDFIVKVYMKNKELEE